MTRPCNDGVGELSDAALVSFGIAGQGGHRCTIARTPMASFPSRGRFSYCGLPETASEHGGTPGAELRPAKDLRIVQWGRGSRKENPSQLFGSVRNCGQVTEGPRRLARPASQRKPVTRHAQHYIPDVCPHCGESVVIPARFEDDNARVVIFPIQQLDAVYGPGPDLEH